MTVKAQKTVKNLGGLAPPSPDKCQLWLQHMDISSPTLPVESMHSDTVCADDLLHCTSILEPSSKDSASSKSSKSHTSSILFGTQKSRVQDTDANSVCPKDSTWPTGKVYVWHWDCTDEDWHDDMITHQLDGAHTCPCTIICCRKCLCFKI